MSKVRLLGTALVMLLGVAVLGLPALATGDKAGKDTEKKDRPKETEGAKIAQNYILANRLIDYGLANKSPLALLSAAEILHNTPEVKNDPKRVIKTEGVEKVKNEASPRSAEDALAQAQKLAKSLKTKDYDAAIAATKTALAEKSRSPYPGGFVRRSGHIHSGERHSYWIHCHGHTHANVYPHFQQGYVDLDLFVYDSSGNLRAVERSTNSSSAVHWDGYGDFRIVVEMYAGDHCNYTLIVN